MNRVELAARKLALTPLRSQRAVAPVACTPTLGIFFAAAALSYKYFNGSNGHHYVETDAIDPEQLTSDQLVATRRELCAR